MLKSFINFKQLNKKKIYYIEQTAVKSDFFVQREKILMNANFFLKSLITSALIIN